MTDDMGKARQNQYDAIRAWMKDQGLPEVFKADLQPSPGARDLFKVTYDSGEVLLSVDPPAAPEPSVTKVYAKAEEIPKIEDVVHIGPDQPYEDTFGITADQLRDAVKSFTANSTSEDTVAIRKLIGNAEELASQLEAIMPRPSSPLPEMDVNGQAKPTDSFYELSGLELGHQAGARQRRERIVDDVVQFSSALVRSVLEYAETWR